MNKQDIEWKEELNDLLAKFYPTPINILNLSEAFSNKHHLSTHHVLTYIRGYADKHAHIIDTDTLIFTETP